MAKILVLLFTLGAYLLGNNEVQQAMADESWEKIEAVNSFAPYGFLYLGVFIFFAKAMEKLKDETIRTIMDRTVLSSWIPMLLLITYHWDEISLKLSPNNIFLWLHIIALSLIASFIFGCIYANFKTRDY